MSDQIAVPKETLEVSLRIEKYEDIFSSFDMRPYSKRALSVDFLDEIRRATSEKKDVGVEMTLHLLEKDRKEYEENIIKERLAAHFKRHFHLLSEKKRQMIRTGSVMIAMGVMAMVAATFILFQDPSDSMFLSFLLVFLEPAAWFMLWEGADLILFNSKNINPDLDFYRKMSLSHKNIYFKSY